MDYELSEELRQLKTMARDIVDKECIPLEAEYLRDETKEMSQEHEEHLKKISKEAEIWDAHVPAELGGGGMGNVGNVVILEETSRSVVGLPRSNVPVILYECNEEQREHYLDPVIRGEKRVSFGQTEPQSGSDPGRMMQTRAILEGDTWTINGRKFFNSGMLGVDAVMLQAVTDPNKRQRGGITMFLVDTDTPGVEISEIKTWHNRPRSAATCEVVYDNVKVPAWKVLGEVGNGFRLGQRWLTTHDRLLRGGSALGQMTRSFDLSVNWARHRWSHGKPIASRQAVQWMIVDMYVWIEALRALTYQAAWRADNGYEAEARYQGSLIKLVSAQWGFQCIDNAMQVLGGIGETLDLPITRFYRTQRHARIGGGTDEIQKMVLARWILGREVADM